MRMVKRRYHNLDAEAIRHGHFGSANSTEGHVHTRVTPQQSTRLEDLGLQRSFVGDQFMTTLVRWMSATTGPEADYDMSDSPLSITRLRLGSELAFKHIFFIFWVEPWVSISQITATP